MLYLLGLCKKKRLDSLYQVLFSVKKHYILIKNLEVIHYLWQVMDGWETLNHTMGFDKLRFMEKSWVQMSPRQNCFLIMSRNTWKKKTNLTWISCISCFIYNADETGLNWKALPSKSLVSQHEAAAPEYKVSKDQVTVMVCGNATDTHKIPLLLIGKSTNPRCFKNVKIPLTYKSKKKTHGWTPICSWNGFNTHLFLKWNNFSKILEKKAKFYYC